MKIVGFLIIGYSLFLLGITSAPFGWNSSTITCGVWILVGIAFVKLGFRKKAPVVTKSPFPTVLGVKLLEINSIDNSHSYVSGVNNSGSIIHSSYDTAAWGFVMTNESPLPVNVILNFSLVNKRGITQEKTSLEAEIESGETVEKKLRPSGNKEKVILKKITVRNADKEESISLDKVIGSTGIKPSRTIPIMIASAAIMFLLLRACTS